VHFEPWMPVLILAVCAGVWWFAAKPLAVFVVRVRDGVPQATHGKVTDSFLAAVGEVFREFSLRRGEIRGVAKGRRIALWFSAGIPPAACQRLRNWWVMSGWSARPRRG
jgi:hypothetical protein